MEVTQRLKQAIGDYKNGKEEAFNVLYEESSKYIYTCIYKVMQGNDNTQDICCDMMQDTYVEISRSIAQLDDTERFFSWAGTIATRKCYAYLKKNKKYVLLAEEDNTFEQLSDSDAIIPEEVMQDREKQKLLRDIINTQLTEMQRLCIIAYYYNEQKQSEIALEFGIPENTVKTNLSRAKAKIKEGVLDLEHKKGTKLYSVAPVLLLLFADEVKAAVVPEVVQASVFSAISAGAAGAGAAGAGAVAGGTSAGVASAAGTTGFLAKIAATSVTTKIVASVAAVAVVGAVGFAAVSGGATKDDIPQGNAGTNQPVNSEVVSDNPSNNTQGSSNANPEQIEVSDEELKAFEVLAQYMSATRWGEDLVWETILPTEENICQFISRMACENQYYEVGAYENYLPEAVTDEIYGSTYTSEGIKAYAQNVFGMDIADLDAVWYWKSGDKYLAMEAQYPSGDNCKVERVRLEGEYYFVHGRVIFGDYEELDQKGGGVAYNGGYSFVMQLEKNENSPFGYTFINIKYGKWNAQEEENIESLKDVLLHPEEYEGYYFYDFNKDDIYFTLVDVDGDNSRELILANNYRDDYQAPSNVFNVITQKCGEIYDLDKLNHYSNIGTFTLYNTGILKTELGDEEETTNFYNLSTGQIWAGRKAAKSTSGGTYTVITDLETDATSEGVLANAKFNELSSGEEVELVWYLATEENINNVFGK